MTTAEQGVNLRTMRRIGNGIKSALGTTTALASEVVVGVSEFLTPSGDHNEELQLQERRAHEQREAETVNAMLVVAIGKATQGGRLRLTELPKAKKRQVVAYAADVGLFHACQDRAQGRALIESVLGEWTSADESSVPLALAALSQATDQSLMLGDIVHGTAPLEGISHDGERRSPQLPPDPQQPEA